MGGSAYSTVGTSVNYYCSVDGAVFFVKVSPHRLHKPENATFMPRTEISVMRVLKHYIIDRGLSPHIVEILAQFDCTGISKYITNGDQCMREQLNQTSRSFDIASVMCRFSELIDEDVLADSFSVLFAEYCNMVLDDFLHIHPPIIPHDRDILIASIIFQIYYTLAVICDVLPSFRHGDLFLHNIMLIIDPNSADDSSYAGKYLRYTRNNRIWNVPFLGFYIKIIDFGYSEITSLGINRAHTFGPRADDHINFITSLERFINDNPIYESSFIDALLRGLGQRIMSPITPAAAASIRSKYQTPTEALDTDIFNIFEANVDDSKVINSYGESQ